jgi:hypothetical protein
MWPFIFFVGMIAFAFNWNLERDRKEKILKSLPENIKSIYLPEVKQ